MIRRDGDGDEVGNYDDDDDDDVVVVVGMMITITDNDEI